MCDNKFWEPCFSMGSMEIGVLCFFNSGCLSSRLSLDGWPEGIDCDGVAFDLASAFFFFRSANFEFAI